EFKCFLNKSFLLSYSQDRMNASQGLFNRTLTSARLSLDSARGCCSISAPPITSDGFGASFMDDREQFIMHLVLLIKSESLIHLVQDRRPSKEVEIMTAV
uniref:Uncharacterized protein n=1 Tax=Electrophorus electricus TaxID=8005 RepID=A0A4W4EFC6_ELEEL